MSIMQSAFSSAQKHASQCKKVLLKCLSSEGVQVDTFVTPGHFPSREDRRKRGGLSLGLKPSPKPPGDRVNKSSKAVYYYI